MNKEISNKENDNFITIRGIRFQIPQTKNPITNWRKTKILAWELLGTAVFTYGICQATTPYYVSLSLFAGLLLTAPISGGHLNSGVSLGFFIKGDIPILELLFRMIGQFVGAIIGGFFAFIVTNTINSPEISGFSYVYEDGETMPGVFGVFHALSGEVLGTFFLTFAVLVMTDKSTSLYNGQNQLVPLFTIAMCFQIARGITPRTGGNLNPAIGPALAFWQSVFDGQYNPNSPFLILFLGPYTGSFLGAIYYRFIHSPLCRNESISDNIQQVKQSLRNVHNNQRKSSEQDIELKENTLNQPLTKRDD